MPESIEQLDLLLLTLVSPRKIMRDGIHFQGLRYLNPVLADYVGESVTVRYDPASYTQAPGRWEKHITRSFAIAKLLVTRVYGLKTSASLALILTLGAWGPFVKRPFLDGNVLDELFIVNRNWPNIVLSELTSCLRGSVNVSKYLIYSFNSEIKGDGSVID